MVGVTQDSSAENFKYMVNVVKTLKITEYDGKNVKTVVGIIQGVVGHIRNMIDAIGQIALPKYISGYLLDIYNTTSVT